MLIAVIILGVLNAALLLLFVRKSSQPADTSSALLLKQDLTTLTESVTKLKDGLQKELTGHLGKSQEGLLRQFAASNKIVADVSKQLEALKNTNQQVINVTDELKTLQNILTNPKQRGNVGEIHLETILQNFLPPGVFQMQYGFKNGDKVDAVIHIDKHIVPVDSKFSLENYNRLIEATDDQARTLLTAQFKSDIKKRIDETSKYIRPNEGTTDFAIMFIPSEAIYYDLLVNKTGVDARSLIEYASRDRKVIIASPTTFLAYLQTVLQGLRSLKIEEQAKEIQGRVVQLSRHLEAHETSMQRLGNSLGATVNHFNSAHKELKKVDKDIVKIADTSPNIQPVLLDRPADNED